MLLNAYRTAPSSSRKVLPQAQSHCSALHIQQPAPKVAFVQQTSIARLHSKGRRPTRRRTSQHWWDDEEEFDAVTDALQPKAIVLVTQPEDDQIGSIQTLRECLDPVHFAAGFSSEHSLAFAQELWAGRDRAPLFLKVRKRAALDAAEADDGDAASDALQELLQQNWGLELDAGLGVLGPEREWLLVVCGSAAAARLMAACGSSGVGGRPRPGSVSVLCVGGTAAGDPAEWQQLHKSIALEGMLPETGQQLEWAALAKP